MQRVTGLDVDISGDGEVILFIHGAFIQDAMLPITQEKPLMDYKLIRYHRRNYGASAQSQQDFSIENEAGNALDLLNALQISKAHVVGFSAGGAIATHLALIAPQIVHSLTLIEPALYSAVTKDPALAGFAQTALDFYANGKRAEAIEAFFGAVSGTQWREEFAQIFPFIAAQTDTNADFVFQEEIKGVDAYRLSKETAQQIKQPILILLSEEFGPFASYVHTLQDWLPLLQVITVPDANHNLPWKQPTFIAQTIKRFLTNDE